MANKVLRTAAASASMPAPVSADTAITPGKSWSNPDAWMRCTSFFICSSCSRDVRLDFEATTKMGAPGARAVTVRKYASMSPRRSSARHHTNKYTARREKKKLWVA